MRTLANRNPLILIFLLALCVACSPSYTYTYNTTKSSTGVKASIKPDSAVEAVIKPYRAQLNAEMTEVIGEAATDISKNSEVPESPLGKVCVDMLLAQARKRSEAKVDLALINTGGLRVPIAQGPIDIRLIFELMPFENEVVVVELTGKELQALFQKNSEKRVWPVAGAIPTYRRGQLVEVKIGGKALEPEATYYLATSDYLAKGGDDMGFLIGQPSVSLGIKVREAFIAQIKALTAKGQKLRVPQGDRAIFE